MKEDKLNELIGVAYTLLKEKRKLFLWILVAVAAVVAVPVLLRSQAKQKELVSVRLLSDGQTAFREGEFSDALALFEKARKDYPGSKAGEIALVYAGESLFHLARLKEAEVGFNDYLLQYAGGEFSARARQGLGFVFEERGEFQKAIDVYRKVYVDYPESYLSPQAILSVGRCYEAMGLWEKAKESYEKLVTSYPWSSSVALARAYLDVAEWEIKEIQNQK